MYKPEANNSSHQVPMNVFTKYRHYIHFFLLSLHSSPISPLQELLSPRESMLSDTNSVITIDILQHDSDESTFCTFYLIFLNEFTRLSQKKDVIPIKR